MQCCSCRTREYVCVRERAMNEVTFNNRNSILVVIVVQAWPQKTHLITWSFFLRVGCTNPIHCNSLSARTKRALVGNYREMSMAHDIVGGIAIYH